MGLAWPSTLPRPLLEGYSTSPGNEIVRTDMESGEARARRRSVSAPDNIKLSWLLDATQMSQFRAYWDAELAGGAAWCDMSIDVGNGIEQKAVRVIGQYTALRVSAAHWKVSCEAEARKLRSTIFDYLNLMGLPSLDLNFAATQSLDPVITSSRQPAPIVSFSRASIATYFGSDGLLKTADVSEPRFEYDPISHVCKGLLIEEARTNLLTYSEQLDNAVWAKLATTVVANSVAAPDGSMSSDTLVEDTSTGFHQVSQTKAATISSACALSVYVKAAGRTALQVRWRNSAATTNWIGGNFDISGGGIATPLTSGTGSANGASITALSNGWFKCSVWGIADSSGTSGDAVVIIQNPAGTSSYAGNGTSGLYLWGAQLEVGSFPTSYIPTTSVAVSRSADLASMTGANFSSWFNSSEGTVVVNGDSAGALAGHYPWCLSDNVVSASSATLAAQFRVSSNQIRVWQSTSGGGLDDFITPNAASKYGHLSVAYGAGQRVSASALGGAVVTMTVDMQTSLFNGLVIGNAAGYLGAVNGHITRLTYYPKRLPNATLQALSA